MFTIAGSAQTLEQQTACAAFAAARHVRDRQGSVGAASHRSAARLYGMRSVDTEIDVSVCYPRRLLLPGVRVVRSRDLLHQDVTWVDGIPTTSPARTILDLGLIFPDHEVLRILRHAIAIGQVNRSEALEMRLRTSEHGRDGAGRLGRGLEVLADLAEDTESGAEALFLEVCEQQGLPTPVLQLPVMANGRWYRLDFAYPAQKVFIEIDGAPHDDPVRIAKDGGRQNDLVAHGWYPIRLHYRQLTVDPEGCAETIRQLLSMICEPHGATIHP